VGIGHKMSGKGREKSRLRKKRREEKSRERAG